MEGERMKGTLIVLEGIDGSGKETQSALLEKKLRQEKRKSCMYPFLTMTAPHHLW